MTEFAPLDNPIWHALSTVHRSLAQSHGHAARYPSDVSPLAGLAEPTPRAFADMARLVEISAVCTHPGFRGRGYGRAMAAFVAAHIFAANKTPFLHVVPENPAIGVYRKVGLATRCEMCLRIIAPR